jgi:aryl-alcohol dehydrogenase-like predicted oxidoreductase
MGGSQRPLPPDRAQAAAPPGGRRAGAPSAPRRTASQIVEAQWTAREHRLERFRTEQPPYSLPGRGIELDVLPTAQRHGMGFLTYSPLGGGWLPGNWSADSSPTSPARQRLAAQFDMSLPENQRKLEAVQQRVQVADEAGLSGGDLPTSPNCRSARSNAAPR